MKTEQQLREEEVITPKSAKELTKYITALTKQDHDYGTCVYAMSMAATAAFNYVSSQLGVSGFQASCADLDFIRRSRGIKGPFMIVDFNDELYESGRTVRKVKESVDKNRTWLMKEARKRLMESDSACEEVYSRWIELAYGYLTAEQRLQWNEENPENKIDEAWLQDNVEKYDFYTEKMKFATSNFTPEFIKANHDQMVKYGYTKVYGYAENYFDLIPDALSITDRGCHRFDMYVSFHFETKIGDVLFEWSIDTEKKGSNGTPTYNFDWDLLQKIYDLAIGDNKKFVDNYIQRCQEAVNKQNEEQQKN